ncbi:MAG: response regulator [Thermoanaerobaculia bacterium]|nr:response regulator [Thermoanaerobaculia bacterium]
MRVLLVEDSESDARLIREMLAETADAEIDLKHVERLSDGIRRLEEELFDAVLLDLSLPDSSGLETFDRAHRVAPDVPIVVVTGLSDETRAGAAAARGAQDYLVKNELTGRALRRSLRYAVERQRLLHEMGERIKERDCLYRVNATLRRSRSRTEAFRKLVELLPAGWQYPELTRARIRWRDREFAASDFHPTTYSLEAALTVGGEPEGMLEIIYLDRPPDAPEDPFLAEEHDLIREVAQAVSEFLRTEQQQEEQRRLATAIEQSGDSVTITDPEGKILYVNPAFEQMTGWSAEEATGRTPRILKSGQHDDAFYDDLWRTIGSGERWSGRFVNRRRDGTLYRADTTISPVRDASGEIVSFVAVQRDITKEAELEERLRQSQKLEAVGQLAGGVAHDFNNLLTVINGNAELILTRETMDGRHRESVEQIRTAGERAADLTRQLLAFSRKQVLDARPLDLGRLVERFQKMMRRVIREEITLQIHTGEESVPVEADAGSLEQVLLNLVVNARDAISDAGTIEITVGRRELDARQAAAHAATAGTYASLTVRDDGAGMSPEVVERAFEPFFTTKEEGKGSGLGLATVYGIVRQMQGFVAIDSEVGRGTEIEVLIPIGSESALTEESGDRLETPPPEGREPLLLVEDDPQVLAVGRSILEQAGYTVFTARNGQEALERLSESDDGVELVITDVVMPRLGGVDLAERLLASDSPPQLLLLTGYAEESVQQRIVATGLPMLRKPFSPYRLLRRVRELLDSSPRRAS